ncbi:DUF4185 domain-containing protein [Desulfosarcina sp.]|uniref:DUF4185 domain-containing protein n=1 Tax=Desulfosarcina sp. TaxID=2027861 RepID=UPI0039705685
MVLKNGAGLIRVGCAALRLERPAAGLRFLLGMILLVAVAGCAAIGHWAAGNAAAALTGRPWPEADRLFRQDTRWLGADDAHSVDLGKGRTLWLFGDSFIRSDGVADRSRATLVRNSIGIQTGSDPSSADMAFFWGQAAPSAPGPFFPGSGRSWRWPGDGIRIGGRLLIFLTTIAPSANDLGFTMTAWQAVAVENPDAPPGRWQVSQVSKNPDRFALLLGTGGVLAHDGYLYAYGSDSGGSQAYLARWQKEKAGAGDLREPQWWCGASLGWRVESRVHGMPAALFADAQAEFNVHYEPRIERFVQIQTVGFGAAGLGFRIARRPEGPWGPLTGFYRPEEASIPGILIYAAKSHPFLTGADLVVTYATNHMDPQRLMDAFGLYFPRFLRVDLQPKP